MKKHLIVVLTLMLIISVVFACGPSPCQKKREASAAQAKAEAMLAISKSVDSTVRANSLASEPKITSKPIPSITKFKVSDCVVAWGRIKGVVRLIAWSENDPDVLVYWLGLAPGTPEDTDNGYYESELTAGSCN